MLWTLIIACTSVPVSDPVAPEADLPAWVAPGLALTQEQIDVLAEVRLRVGLAAKGDEARCEALDAVTVAQKALGAHFHDNPTLPAETLSDAIPGLIFTAGATPAIDQIELSRAFGPAAATTAMISATSLLGDQSIWRHPDRQCFDTEAARPWIRRLGPSMNKAPDCLADHYREALETALGEMARETCYCADEPTTRKGAETLAVLLSNTKDPDGSKAAGALREALQSEDVRFACDQP